MAIIYSSTPAKKTTAPKRAATNPLGGAYDTPAPAASPFVPVTAPATSFVGPVPAAATRTDTGYSTTTNGVVTTVTPGTPVAPKTTVTTSQAVPVVDPFVQQQIDAENAKRVDAFKLLEDVFKTYNLESLVPKIQELMVGTKDPITGKITQIGPNEATLLLKQTPEYKARFVGNEARAKAGLNVLNEDTYLRMENAYSELFKQYGVQNLATRNEFANLIGADISNTELGSRLDLAVNQVANADPTIKNTLRQFYPNITDADLTAYFLRPQETLPALQQKVLAAEIGTAAIEQGLPTDVLRATELAKAGVTQPIAQKGYAAIATELPVAQKLSDIYKEQGIGYDLKQAEAYQFDTSGAASAARKRQQMKQLEEASFSGRSGVDLEQVAPLGKGVNRGFTF